MKILILGNPVDGFRFIGPIEDERDPGTLDEYVDDGDWWVAPLEALV